ncbi:MAG TPA: hypothetical protein VE860_18720 [Chthoniobacterales bacterium]|jgi:hypothetical protein|nr:hypothetical protein [Chthoniobacterales bacterium]
MPETLYEVVFANSKWWFRSPSNESSFSSRIEAIEAAIQSARSQSEVLLRIHKEAGAVEAELNLSATNTPAHPATPQVKPPKEVDRDTARSVHYYATRPTQLLSKRIAELADETPLETFVFRGGAILTIAGLTLLLLKGKGRAAWALVVAVAALQLQYSHQGRNGLTDLLRRRGYRSRKEIEAEKYSLKALRGDFAAIAELDDPVDRARKYLGIFL